MSNFLPQQVYSLEQLYRFFLKKCKLIYWKKLTTIKLYLRKNCFLQMHEKGGKKSHIK